MHLDFRMLCVASICPIDRQPHEPDQQSGQFRHVVFYHVTLAAGSTILIEPTSVPYIKGATML